MSEFDELVARPGVLMAGRFGADGRAAEHNTTGWTYPAGDYAIAVHGDRFAIGERAKLGSLDELSRLLRAGQQ